MVAANKAGKAALKQLLAKLSANVNWNKGVRKMTDSGGLSWEAQEVLKKIKSFNRLPGAGIALIQLNMRVGSAKTVKKGIPELNWPASSPTPLRVSRRLLIKATRPQFDRHDQTNSPATTARVFY